MDRGIYLIILEWDNNEWLEPNFPNYHITTYEDITRKIANQYIKDADKYSVYDYLDHELFTSKEEFNKKVEYFKRKGVIINK